MKKIWKYEIPAPPAWHETSSVALPSGAEVLSVQAQGEAIVLWALCDTEAPLVDRGFWVIGTGWELPDGEGNAWHFRGTVQLPSVMGVLAWHVWEQG